MSSSIRHILLLLAFAAAFAAGAQKTYVVAVGLDNYSDGQNSLSNPVADMKGVCKFFNNYNGGDVFLLANSNATRDHILRVARKKFSLAGPADEVIFAYSGHGFDGGLSTYDTSEYILVQELLDILNASKARRKIMFINSCHSGSFADAWVHNPRNKGYKGASQSPVMLYVSSRSSESSWGSDGMKYSFFIDGLLRGLNGNADKNGDRKITARELFNYVNQETIDISGGKQHPQMYGKFPDDMVVVYTD